MNNRGFSPIFQENYLTRVNYPLGYLTMYRNSPAEITAQFHFIYKDKSKSVMYDLFMPDTVAELHNPVPATPQVLPISLGLLWKF